MSKYGIDVSSYQGAIDWKKVKTTDVEFAILKVIRKDLNPDKQFESNWKGCNEAGMPIKCVYNYSYATTVSKAKSDAEAVLKILNGRKIAVCLDVEDNCQKGLGQLLIDIINAYADVITKAGLDFYVYTGYSFYKTYIKPYNLKYPWWIARYGKNNGELGESYKPDVQGMIGWQFTSKAKVNGISGNVDKNIWYCDVDSKTDVTPTEKLTAVKVDSAKSFSKELAGAYQTTANLNLRCGAGTHKSKITVIPKNGKVRCYGYYTKYDGTIWYLVVYNNHTGFVSSKYCKKL